MSSVNITLLLSVTAEEPFMASVKPRRKRLRLSSMCSKCNKYLFDKYILERHSKKCSGKVRNPPVSGNIVTSNKTSSDNADATGPTASNVRTRSCSICEKSFNFKCNLVRHIKIYHSSIDVSSICPLRNKRAIICPVCPSKIRSMVGLSDHIRDTHIEDETPGIQLFDTVADFLTWKHDEEMRTVSSFVKTHGTKNKNIERYYCRRRGVYKTRGTQKRHTRIQGSCKAGSKCPATITAAFTPRGVMVQYVSTHNGHSMDIKHVALSSGERLQIAGMISRGIHFNKILDNVRDILPSTEISRLHLIERRDLKNIADEFHLSRTRRKQDAERVRVWVKMCRHEKSKIVRFVKYQGEEAADERIGFSDFMIVLMDDMQVYMLQRHGHRRVNCIDSTDGPNAFGFRLTTLVIFDDFGEGFPVAFCISSKVDTLAMEIFLEHVRAAVGGPVDGAVLMTDDAPAYVNAWTTVMGPPDHHILSTWDTDRFWRKNLSKINQSTEFKADVFKRLRALLETDNKEKFHCLLESFFLDMEADESMTEFLLYFCRTYVSRPESWARSYQLDMDCYRSVHNIHLGEFHETLKHVFMQDRKVIRLDLSMNALLSLLRLKTFERILTQDERTLDQHISDIHSRHVLSTALKREQIDAAEDGHWLVHCERGDNTVNRGLTEEISRIHMTSDTLCPLVCDICNVCVHTFTCTCMDYRLRNTVCMHIHAAVQLCGNETVDSHTDCMAVVNFTEQRNVRNIDNELAHSALNNELLAYSALDIEPSKFSSGQ